MSIDKILSSKGRNVATPLNDLVSKVSEVTTSASNTDQRLGSIALGFESLSDSDTQLLSNVYGDIESSVKAIGQELGFGFEDHQVEAGTLAGILGTNPKEFVNTQPKNTAHSNTKVIMPAVSDGYIERQGPSLEAYDERENRNAQLQSIVYNLLSARQDDFGEMFFPTIIVNPNEVGLTITSNLFYVYNDFKRETTGALANYQRRNLVRAYADASILENELTRCVPIYRTGGPDANDSQFVASVPTWNVSLKDGYSVTTSALAVDKKVDLLGMSQTDELLGSGIMGPTDSLDTHIKLNSVFVRIPNSGGTDEIVEIDTSNLVGSTFNFAPQGNYRTMLLSMESRGIILDETAVDVVGGSAISVPAAITGNVVRLELTISGRVSLDKGDLIVNRGSLSVVTVRNAADGEISSDLAAITAAVEDFEVVGYTLTAYRANSNLRQRGQLVDSQTEYRLITVPYRSPIAALAPATQNAQDNSALQTLINATGIRVSNDAVSALEDTYKKLSSFDWDNTVLDEVGESPELDIIGEFYVRPYCGYEKVKISEVLDSIKSHERIKDVRAALVEKIRWHANKMYLETEYKAAANVLTGNKGFKPTVVIGCDPVVANYLTYDGDLRALGDTFDVRIVSSLDSRLVNKIYITFGVFDGNRNTTINPLNFGNMLYSPEVTVQMPISRDGQISNELIVSPRYIHNVSLPALVKLDVEELPIMTDRIPYEIKS